MSICSIWVDNRYVILVHSGNRQHMSKFRNNIANILARSTTPVVYGKVHVGSILSCLGYGAVHTSESGMM